VVKKTPFEQYQTRPHQRPDCHNLDDGDELKWIRMTRRQRVVISTSQGQAFVSTRRTHARWDRVSRGVRWYPLASQRPGDRMDRRSWFRIFVISKFGTANAPGVTVHAARPCGVGIPLGGRPMPDR